MIQCINSKHIVTPEGIISGQIVIEQGKIVEIRQSEFLQDNILDVGELYVLPGLVDTHVHINEPGREDWEGFESATKAALAGGITTLLDMPLNSSPVTTSVSAFEQKLLATKDKLYCNTGFIGGLIPDNNDELKSLKSSGVYGYKCFLTHSGIDEFPNMTENDLHSALPILTTLNLPLMVHAELDDTSIKLPLSANQYNDFLQSRPGSMEYRAISMITQLAEKYNTSVHIVHLSEAGAIDLLDGPNITVETCPHYLYFNSESIGDGLTQFKCMPPIRSKQNQQQLWQAIRDGRIDCIVSDHSPCTAELKKQDTGDFMQAWGGIASLQFTLSAVHTRALQEDVNIQTITKLMSNNPAKIFGIENKGAIASGMDADLVIFDPAKKFTVQQDNILHKNTLTPYLGEQFTGKVIRTILAGVVVYENEVINIPRGKILLKK